MIMLREIDSIVNRESLSGWIADHLTEARQKADRAKAEIQSPTVLPHNVAADGSTERYHFADAESVVWRKVGEIIDNGGLTTDQAIAKVWRYSADLLYDMGRNRPNLGPRPVADAIETIRNAAMVKAVALVMNEILAEVEDNGSCGDS